MPPPTGAAAFEVCSLEQHPRGTTPANVSALVGANL
jgi:hypothetical protein